MRPDALIRRSAAYLARHGVESPRETAEALMMSVLGTDRAGLYVRSESLDAAAARRFGRALCQRCSGTPLQHLTGSQQFLDLTLAVSPGVFVPRPETEGLVEAALEVLTPEPGPVVVDVGTGTGAVALAVKHRRPDALVVATDRSTEAVNLARRNAARLGLAVDVRPGDLLAPVPAGLHGRVALIVSNPPYVTEEAYADLPVEVRADPYDALVGGTAFHRRLAAAAGTWLRPHGWLVVEIGAAQGEEVREIMSAALEDVRVLPDLAGRDRVVHGRLAAAR